MTVTEKGINRRRYSREVEAHPSRFTGDNTYTEWAARADAHADQNGRTA